MLFIKIIMFMFDHVLDLRNSHVGSLMINSDQVTAVCKQDTCMCECLPFALPCYLNPTYGLTAEQSAICHVFMSCENDLTIVSLGW